MRTSTRPRIQRFRNFLLESQDEVSLVTFTFRFAESPLPAVEADLVAVEAATWLQSALGLEDGAILMSAVEDDLGVHGWEVGVVTSDAKQASLLSAYLESGTIGPFLESATHTIGLRFGGLRRSLLR